MEMIEGNESKVRQRKDVLGLRRIKVESMSNYGCKQCWKRKSQRNYVAWISEPLVRTVAEKLCRFNPHCSYLLSL